MTTQSNSLVAAVFQEDLTQQGLAELRQKFPADLVLDMSDEATFKQARKTKTERNKLLKSIKDKRISFTSEVKAYGDDLESQVTDIYSVVVEPFEAEDKRRKEEAERLKAEREALLNAQRAEIANIRGFVTQCQGQTSQFIADSIEAVDLIETDCFDKELIHEAIETKKEVLGTLQELYNSAKANEAVQAEREELRAKEEAINKQRLIDNRLNELRNSPMAFFNKPSKVIADRITQLENTNICANDYGDRLEEAVQAKAQVIQQLQMMKAQAEQLEAVAPVINEPAVQEATQVSQESKEAIDQAITAPSNQEPLLGNTVKSKALEQAFLSYEPLDVWPSDQDRFENDDLDRICQKLEQAEDYIAALQNKQAA